MIGSVGVALAFLGTVLVYFASRHAGGGTALNWSTLVGTAPRLDPGVLRLAIGLLVLGYGTKVGLAPMHTWLPDAHSQAPAPVSALMSGVLLSVAFYALLRYKVIADAALGAGYMRGLLVTAALLSLAVAASLLLAQRDYKRLLAYSSIEHMGLIALGTAIGTPLAIAATLLHILGHGLGKAVLFCSSGEILFTDGTTRIAGVRGLLARRPLLGGVFGIGLVALLGLPPFSLFASELAIARAGVADGLGWAVAIALVFVFVIFAAVAGHALQMLFGRGGRRRGRRSPHVERRAGAPRRGTERGRAAGRVDLADRAPVARGRSGGHGMSEPSVLGGNRTVIPTPVEGLRDAYRTLTADGYRLALVAAHHDPATPTSAAAMRIVYLLVSGPPDSRVELHVSVDADRPAVPEPR